MHQALLIASKMKHGVPSKAVITPTGVSVGKAMARDIASDHITRAAPASTEIGINK